MANTIRTPKQGLSATSRRIAEAVDDEEWQRFRVSLKGRDTIDKLKELEEYHVCNDDDADVEIRVDNYIKALARGGQLFSGASLEEALRVGGIHKLPIKRSR